MALHQSRSLMRSVKSLAHWIWLIPLCSVYLVKMVSSLQSIVLYSVPIAVLFDMLKLLYYLPMGQPILRALFRRCGHHELGDLAKTLPWNHPIARKLDHEVHRRRMAGESYFSFVWVWVPSLHPFFPFPRCVSGDGFSTRRLVACPPLPFPSAMSIELGRAVLGTNHFTLIFLDSLDYMDNAPVYHIYQWLALPSRDGVCNHCERMMEGLRLEDVIAGNSEGSLTEDDIVGFVRAGDSTNQAWDDWPLRMTFRINSFLRSNGPVPEPDLAELAFLDD